MKKYYKKFKKGKEYNQIFLTIKLKTLRNKNFKYSQQMVNIILLYYLIQKLRFLMTLYAEVSKLEIFFYKKYNKPKINTYM